VVGSKLSLTGQQLLNEDYIDSNNRSRSKVQIRKGIFRWCRTGAAAATEELSLVQYGRFNSRTLARRGNV